MKACLKPLTTACALLALLLSVASAKTPVKSTPFESAGGGPTYYIDYASFQGIEDKTYVEFYFQIGHNDLQFIKKGKQFQAGYELDFAVYDRDDEVVEQQKISDIFEVDTFAETQSIRKARVFLMAFSFDPGKYRIKAELTDTETRNVSVIEEYITAESFRTSDLCISDIQLSQHIKPAKEGEPYVKNQRYIEPNPVRTFAHGLGDVCVYFEVYNLIPEGRDDNTEYVAHFILRDEDGKEFAHLKRQHKKPGTTAAHSIKLPVEHFLNGRYSLTVRIEDQDTRQIAETTLDFTVLDWPISMNELGYDQFIR